MAVALWSEIRKLTLSISANLGGKAAFVWMALSFVSLIWAWFEVPELRSRTFGELDDLFAQKTPTRQFKRIGTEPISSSSNA